MAKQKNYLLIAVCAFTLIGIVMIFIEQCVISRDFSERRPFKFTINTNNKLLCILDRKDVTIQIATNSKISKYLKYDLDCEGDGQFEFFGLRTDASVCHYPCHSGKHQIWIRGDIAHLYLCPFLNDNADNEYAVESIDDWGSIRWRSMEAFAEHCTELIKIPEEAPNLKNVKDMSRMFSSAYRFNQPLNHWDVSNVKNMSWMFSYSDFNHPLDNWDVSRVENMSYMFCGATYFNQPLENWDVSHVEYMSSMFEEASSFNQPLDNWDVSHVLNMEKMFYHENVDTIVAIFSDTHYRTPDFEYYPSTWVIPQRSADMFTGTKLEKKAKSEPLKKQ